MHGNPVTIRTIDPPLHEFLPKREELMVEIAVLETTDKNSSKLEEKRRLLTRVEQLHEFNPMLGHRGVRLGIAISGNHGDANPRHHRGCMQRASKEGLKVVPEIMIPLVGDVKELRDQKAIVDRVAAETMKAEGVRSATWLGR